jgi:hypothetical protein
MAGAAPMTGNAAAAPVTVNYIINVSAAGGDSKDIGDAVVAAIKAHDSEVARILNRHHERNARLKF